LARKEEQDRPGWELSNGGLMLFTSLMIIMLAFFILLSSMAVIDEKRQIEALGSLVGTFGILPGGLSVIQEDGSHIAPPTAPMAPIEDDMQLIKSVLSKRILDDKVHILKGRTRRIISIESAMLFPPDGVELLPEMLPELTEIARILSDSDYQVDVEGHTDDQPPQTDRYRDNWEVSSLRAVSVFRFFAEAGINPERMSAYGYSGYDPAVANTTPRKRARNNRIDVILDFSHQKKAGEVDDRRRRDKVFDFRGFVFRLFD
jgi:chemotaxis protein MotB